MTKMKIVVMTWSTDEVGCWYPSSAGCVLASHQFAVGSYHKICKGQSPQREQASRDLCFAPQSLNTSKHPKLQTSETLNPKCQHRGLTYSTSVFLVYSGRSVPGKQGDRIATWQTPHQSTDPKSPLRHLYRPLMKSL